MKQLVICPEDFHRHYEHVLSHGTLTLQEEKISYALIEREDIEFDPQLHADKVLVRKQAFSCNYRDRSLVLSAQNKVKNSPNLSIFSIGSEFSGVVEEVGIHVKKLKKGDRVIGDAFYPHVPEKKASPGIPSNHASSELEIMSEHKLVRMPPNMPFSLGAAFTVGAQTVYSMVEKLDIKENDKVLITGIKSNTSLFAINSLKKKNVEVCGVTRSRVDEAFFKALGLKRIFYVDDTYSNLVKHPDILQYIMERGKFNCVIDPFSDAYLFKLLDLIEMNGKYVTCGLSNQTAFKPTEIDLSAQLGKLILNNITIMGSCLGSTENLETALSDFSQDQFDVIIDNIINHDVDSFMTKSFLSKDTVGKVVFNY